MDTNRTTQGGMGTWCAGVLAGCLAVVATLEPALAAEPKGGSVWLISSHICPGGNRTDALHRDDDGTLWVGCGTNATGYGLFLSVDGGDRWAAAPIVPADALDQFRVNSISRGHDGALYVAGFRAADRDMVLRFNTAVTPFQVSETLVGVNQVGRSFHVGTYRELSDGAAIAESLNGVDLLYRKDASTGSSATGWTSRSLDTQILDMAVLNDKFYGAGGVINKPPVVFLPPRAVGAEPYEFEVLEPRTSNGWEGELWGLAVSPQRLVAVGVDQDDDDGKILVSSADPYDPNGYTEFSLSVVTGQPTFRSWARGVCMRGNRIVVVGERQPLSNGTGRVVMSTDGGASFQNITPAGVSSSVSKCLIEPDGTVVVAGAAGFVGILPGDPLIFGSGFEGP